MKKKLSFYVGHMCLVLYSFVSFSQDSIPLPNTSYLMPYTVIRILWNQTPKAFVHVWNECVALYKRACKKFTTKSQVYAFVVHCRFIHKHFLSHLYVDATHNVLVYSFQHAYAHDSMRECKTVFSFLKNNNTQALCDFYAIYFDCVVTLFLDTLNFIEKKVPIQNTYTQLEQYYGELLSLMPYLRGSVYEKRYAQQIQRYQELVALVGSRL